MMNAWNKVCGEEASPSLLDNELLCPGPVLDRELTFRHLVVMRTEPSIPQPVHPSVSAEREFLLAAYLLFRELEYKMSFPPL